MLLLSACGQASGAPGRPDYAGRCLFLGAAAQELQFAPRAGEPGPAFRLARLQGAGDYDAAVNAVDGSGRYGPDARGTVHAEASLRAGTLTTPDLKTPSGETVRYGGAWHCASVTTATPPPERPGGPPSPR